MLYHKKNIQFCQDVFPLFHSLPTAAAFHIFFKKQMHKKHHTGLRRFFIKILLKNIFCIIRHYNSPIAIQLCFIRNFSVRHSAQFALGNCAVNSISDCYINQIACTVKAKLLRGFFYKVGFIHTTLLAKHIF